VLIRRELEELPSDFATQAGAYVHSSSGVLRLGEPPRGKRRYWPKEKLKVQRQLHDRHVALNEALEKYVFRPRATYIITGRAWMFGMMPDENVRWFKMHFGYETMSEAYMAKAAASPVAMPSFLAWPSGMDASELARSASSVEALARK
jgi:hypothetical protein